MPQSYLEWNDALASRIFRPEMAGRQVYLFVNDDLVEEIGGAGSTQRLVSRVLQGPPWTTANMGLCQKALRAFQGWRERGLAYPPYVGYLGLFVLAVGTEGNFAAHAYYPRLRTLLGWPDVDGGAPPSFERMLDLWDDLEVWSNRDMAGALGVFSIRITGEWIHVGLPKAQALLTEHERRALPRIFSAAAFDPTAPPSDADLAHALRRHGAQVLRQPTLNLCTDGTAEPGLVAVLFDAVRDEFEDWDGTVSGAAGGNQGAATALARVCLRVDEVAARVTATLRVAAKAEFPEEGLLLRSSDGNLEFSCVEYLPGWSSPLRDTARGREVDAAEIDWSQPLLLRDDAADWRVRVPRARVRIFVPGLPLDLPALVEVRGLAMNRPFKLAASEEALTALNRWVESGEVDLQEIRIIQGLPPGWKLFASAGARSDHSIRGAIPELALPTGVRLKLPGGIRSGQGSTFFRFAPPTVVIEGGSGSEEVLCNGVTLSPLLDSGVFPLPVRLPTEGRITVEIRADGEVVRRQSLFVSDEFDWGLSYPIVTVGRLGIPSIALANVEPCNDRIAGVLGGPEPGLTFPIRPGVAPGKRILFIGRRVGQILQSMGNPHTEEWQPIWQVELDRRGRVDYCGRDLANASPIVDSCGTAESIALWRDVLWLRRKRIVPPDHPVLQRLWREYVMTGSRV